ncbi:protein tyrosine phosphatase [Rhizobiales bacterium Sp-1]|uniref:Protein tyrosine phosphatase n=1 Tax=Segnochrobactrum spirostomi TaxID=2608987 RepID=A0A6A7Y4R8_9HYPH|nr:protein tyrosine phosphatase [Segnochrobactrum spirostomi]
MRLETNRPPTLANDQLPSLATRRGRFAAWIDLIFVDHGFLRLAYLNLHRVGGEMWRAAQPAPADFRRLAADKGIRTVVNLRGGRDLGGLALEEEACRALGIALVELPFRTRVAPAKETIREAAALFDRIAYPALMHCKSGADRSGFAGALYLILKEGRSAAEAEHQLSLRYGHLKASRAGILDAFLERYRTEGEANGLSLLDWVETRYDPARLQAAFKPQRLASWLVDRVLKRE